MTKVQEFCVVAGILLLGIFGILKVAEDALRRQDLIQQEEYHMVIFEDKPAEFDPSYFD